MKPSRGLGKLLGGYAQGAGIRAYGDFVARVVIASCIGWQLWDFALIPRSELKSSIEYRSLLNKIELEVLFLEREIK